MTPAMCEISSVFGLFSTKKVYKKRALIQKNFFENKSYIITEELKSADISAKKECHEKISVYRRKAFSYESC